MAYLVTDRAMCGISSFSPPPDGADGARAVDGARAPVGALASTGAGAGVRLPKLKLSNRGTLVTESNHIMLFCVSNMDMPAPKYGGSIESVSPESSCTTIQFRHASWT
jgi:hypothetical protein